VGCRAALQILELSFLVLWRVHCGRKVDHPGEDRLDHGVVHQIDWKTDAAEEVEHWRAQHLAGISREENTEQYDGGSDVVPVSPDIGFVNGDAGHYLLHDVGPTRVVWVVLRITCQEHAEKDHERGNWGGQNRGGGVLEVVVHFGHEHAHYNVQAF